MYSYPDRIRAVELYIKLGVRVRATIRRLGVPNQERIERLVSALPKASGFANKPSSKSTKILAAAKGGGGCSLPRP